MAQSEGYNEQETIFRYEKAFLSTIKPILWMLGGDYLFSDGPQPIDHSAELPHPWRLGAKHHGDKRHRTDVTFQEIYYTDGSSEVLGIVTSEPIVQPGEGWSNFYENNSDAEIEQDITISMELEQTQESSYSAEVSFSITNRVEVKVGDSATTGAEGTASSETTASSSFGLNESKGTTKVETYSDTTIIKIAPNSKLRATSDKVRYTEIRTVREEGYIDFKFDIKMMRWSCGRNGLDYLCKGESYEPLHFDNIQDFIDFVRGRHLREHPHMEHFLQDMSHRCKSTHGNGFLAQNACYVAGQLVMDRKQVASESVDNSQRYPLV